MPIKFLNISGIPYYIFRWFLFLLVGLPFQVLSYALFIILTPIFWLFFRGKYGQPMTPPASRWTTDQLIASGAQDPIRDTYYLDTQDDTGPLIHEYFWHLRPDLAVQGAELLTYPNGSLRRRYPNESYLPVSGDAMSAWVSSYVLNGGDKESLRRLAKHYLKNCFGLGAPFLYNQPVNWQVSSRSSNGGVNYVFDGWAYLNEPCFGPQYYCSAALLLLAAKELGGLWWLAYFLHFWIMGGWLYWICPVLYSNNPNLGGQLYYVQQIAALNLFTIGMLSKNPIYKWAMRTVAVYLAPSGNCDPILYAFAAKIGALKEEEIDRALTWIVSCPKIGWPQDPPAVPAYWNPSNDSQFFSIIGACTKMLLDSKAKYFPKK